MHAMQTAGYVNCLGELSKCIMQLVLKHQMLFDRTQMDTAGTRLIWKSFIMLIILPVRRLCQSFSWWGLMGALVLNGG